MSNVRHLNLTSGLSDQLLRGLSRMLGNWQVRFLEGLGLATPPATRRGRIQRVLALAGDEL